MRTLDPLRAGLAFGALLGLWHMAWAALVASGLGQPLLDFILRLHFIAVRIEVQPFDIATAALLVGVTAVLGFGGGLVVAWVWNLAHRGPPAPLDRI